MNNNPFFSLIVPVYNVETYLKQCIESILNQNFQDFELILINDGSLDTGGEICDFYAEQDNRINVIHQKNGGLSAARNSGLKIASGIYIWFIDSDDWIKDDALNILEQNLLKNDLDVISFSHIEYYELEKQYSNKKFKKRTEIIKGKNYLNNTNDYNTCVWAYIYKKSIIDKYDLKFEVGILLEDDCFNLNCFGKIERFLKISDPLYYYRIRDKSLMTTISRDLFVLRINSLIGIINLISKITDLNSDFLNIHKKYYEDYAYNFLNKFFLIKNISLYEKYKISKKVKNAIEKRHLEKSELSNIGTKLEQITKSAFNLNLFCFILIKESMIIYFKCFKK